MNEGDNSFVPQPPPVNPSHGGASTNAILTLVFGILSWIMCPIILGIVAWVMGNKEINAIDSGLSSPEGRTLCQYRKMVRHYKYVSFCNWRNFVPTIFRFYFWHGYTFKLESDLM